MKIRLLIDAKTPGGIETHVINLCAGLISRDHDCKIIFVCDYANNPLYVVCNARNLPYVTCTNKCDLFSQLHTDKPDIIHTHGYKANILGRLYGLFTQTKTVATYHSGEALKGRLILYDFLDRSSSFLSYNIAVNDIIAKKLPGKVAIIPNFVEIPKKPNTLRLKGPFKIYFIGRFTTEKDPMLFCKLSTILDQNFELHMVGDGPLLANCKANYISKIEFHGLVTEMETIWPDVDMLCITSSYEGLPLVLLDAMSRGIPVAAFDVGSIKDILTDKQYCIDNFDIQHMGDCIIDHFSKSIVLRQQLSQDVRKKIMLYFASQIIIPKIEAFYLEHMKNDK